MWNGYRRQVYIRDGGLLIRNCIKAKFTVIGTTILLLSLLNSCNTNKDKMYKETRLGLYTVVTVTVDSNSEQKANAAIESTFKKLEILGKLLNFYSGY